MSLESKIWITRKCRINLSERLKKNNLFTQSLIVWYSFLLLALTIFDKSNSIFQDSYSLTLILSIGILVLSIFIMAMNYSERAIKAQILYTQLDYLYSQVKSSTQSQQDLYKQYTDLINLTENHSETNDYLKVKYDLRNDDKGLYPEPPALQWFEYIIYWLRKIYLFFFIVFLLFLPLLLIFWIKY